MNLESRTHLKDAHNDNWQLLRQRLCGQGLGQREDRPLRRVPSKQRGLQSRSRWIHCSRHFHSRRLLCVPISGLFSELRGLYVC